MLRQPRSNRLQYQWLLLDIEVCLSVGVMTVAELYAQYDRDERKGMVSNLRAVGMTGVVVLWLAQAAVVMAEMNSG